MSGSGYRYECHHGGSMTRQGQPCPSIERPGTPCECGLDETYMAVKLAAEDGGTAAKRERRRMRHALTTIASHPSFGGDGRRCEYCPAHVYNDACPAQIAYEGLGLPTQTHRT